MLLRTSAGPLRADLRRVYGIDLDAAIEGREVRPIVLWDLVRYLPLDSAMWRELNPDLAWTSEMQLLAAAVDGIAIGNWQRGGGRGKRPKPIPRPGSDAGKTSIKLDAFDSPADFDAWRETQLKR